MLTKMVIAIGMKTVSWTSKVAKQMIKRMLVKSVALHAYAHEHFSKDLESINYFFAPTIKFVVAYEFFIGNRKSTNTLLSYLKTAKRNVE